MQYKDKKKNKIYSNSFKGKTQRYICVLEHIYIYTIIFIMFQKMLAIAIMSINLFSIKFRLFEFTFPIGAKMVWDRMEDEYRGNNVFERSNITGGHIFFFLNC